MDNEISVALWQSKGMANRTKAVGQWVCPHCQTLLATATRRHAAKEPLFGEATSGGCVVLPLGFAYYGKESERHVKSDGRIGKQHYAIKRAASRQTVNKEQRLQLSGFLQPDVWNFEANRPIKKEVLGVNQWRESARMKTPVEAECVSSYDFPVTIECPRVECKAISMVSQWAPDEIALPFAARLKELEERKAMRHAAESGIPVLKLVRKEDGVIYYEGPIMANNNPKN